MTNDSLIEKIEAQICHEQAKDTPPRSTYIAGLRKAQDIIRQHQQAPSFIDFAFSQKSEDMRKICSKNIFKLALNKAPSRDTFITEFSKRIECHGNADTELLFKGIDAFDVAMSQPVMGDVSTRKAEASLSDDKPSSPANYTLPPETIISESHNIDSSEISVVKAIRQILDEQEVVICSRQCLAIRIEEAIRPYLRTTEPVSGEPVSLEKAAIALLDTDPEGNLLSHHCGTKYAKVCATAWGLSHD